MQFEKVRQQNLEHLCKPTDCIGALAVSILHLQQCSIMK